MPLAGRFITPDQVADEQVYPLTVAFCRECRAVQILETVPAEILFRDYRYVSSTTATLSAHFVGYAREMRDRFVPPDGLVVEFGSNDGVLLKPFMDLGVRVVGVEPATNIARLATARGCTVMNDFFTQETAGRIKARYGAATLVCANNVFAHVGDIHEPMRAIRKLLKPDGVFVFEVHYLKSLIERCQFDMIYHEHMLHHSLLGLTHLMELHQMEIFDAKPVPTHAGSIRVYAQVKGSGSYSVSAEVEKMLKAEREMGLDREDTFVAFAMEVRRKISDLIAIVTEVRSTGKTIVGYGASGRASVLLNMCRFGPSIVPYVTDESHERQGRLIPGMHNPIASPEAMRKAPPDYALLFAYNYFAEVMSREREFVSRGGRFIVPLPTPRIIEPTEMTLGT